MTNKLLLINSYISCGKAGLGAMTPVLAHMGYDLYTLPTLLASSSLDQDDLQLYDTTDYMEQALRSWQDLGCGFDAITTGFIGSERQAKLVGLFCDAQRKAGISVFVDPVLGTQGRRFRGIDKNAVNYLRQLLDVADVAMPNYTEACLLTGAPFAEAQGMSETEAYRLLDCLRRMCPKSVVISNTTVDGAGAVIGYDHERDERFLIGFERLLPAPMGVTDIFYAALVGKKLAGLTLEDATAYGMHLVKDLIRKSQGADGVSEGIPIERYLGSLRR